MWRRGFSSVLKPAAEFCLTSQREHLCRVTNPSQILRQIGQRSQLISDSNRLVEGLIGSSEISHLCRSWGQKIPMDVANSGYLNQLARGSSFQSRPCIYRSFSSSSASKSSAKNQKEARKEISTVEDPFDSPTYHIPEKPVSFTEGASYSLVILVGLGIAAAAAYAVFKELIFQPKEYMIFNKALERVQNDGQVRVRIGSPIKGYGQESRNRAARQRIPNRTWKDEDGVEHVEVMFYIRGPHGGGQVRSEMFKDKEDSQWKFTYLTVDILSPSQAHLILESFFSS